MPESKKAASSALKKVSAKKAATEESAVKKAAPRKRATGAPELNVIIEHHNRQIGVEVIAETAKKLWVLAGHDAAEISKIDLYVKQEDGAVYCVVNGEPVGSYDL